MKRILLVITGMIVTLVCSVLVMLFLNDIKNEYQMIIFYLLIVLFIYLGAKLLVLTISLKMKEECKTIISRDYSYANQDMLNDKAVENGFLQLESIPCKNEITAKHFQRIFYNNGTYIHNIFMVDEFPDADNWIQMDEVLYAAMTNCEKGKLKAIVKERITVFCILTDSIDELRMKKILSDTSFVFSIFFPVIIDIKNKKVYHCEIPQNHKNAKGKVVVDLKKLLDSIFQI